MNEILICSLASIPAAMILGRDQFTTDELLAAAKEKLAQYVVEAVSQGSEIATHLVLQLTEMGVFDAADEVPPSDGLQDGDVPSEVDGDGPVHGNPG